MRIILFFSFIFFLSCQRGEVSSYEKYLNHNDTVKYVGKEQCRMCHAEIYDSYLQTGMGKSMHFATRNNSVLANISIPVVEDSIKNLSYKPFFKDDTLFIKEYRVKGLDTTHSLTKKVDYKIGSGHHTNSHLYNINGYIHQMPYTYYTQLGIADLPPGFENGSNTRFSREIGLECMSCHNAYSNHESKSINKYNSISDGIDCERCHGPGELHVQRKLAGEIIDTSKYIDYSIVNPAKLPKDLQFDVCQRCHLQGTSILASGKNFNSFIPGMHLKDVMDTYLPKYKNNNSFIMASHADRLQQSSCFKNSDITCVTCHNPHKSVSKLEEKYFDNKCMSCHDLCEDNKTENCSSCHMPKSTTSDIMHVSITDHKIAVQNNNINRENKDFIGLASINNNNPTNLSKAKAYLKYFESFENKPIYLDSAFYYLNNSSDNFTSFIQYYYLKDNQKGLINYVMSNNIDYSKYSDHDLALAFSRMGEIFALHNLFVKSEEYHKVAVELMTYVIDYKIKYGNFLLKCNKIEQAIEQYNNALDLNPTIKEIHANLGFISIIKGDYNSAKISLNQAIILDPDYLLAYENLLLLSQKQNNLKDTKLYLQKILEINPNHKTSN